MNKVWLFIFLISSITLFFTRPEITINAMVNSSLNCVHLALELAAIYTVWMGILEILDESGLSGKFANLLSPFVKKFFKTNDSEAIKQISICISANMLGVGSAATPSAIKAMQRLDDKSGKISYPMVMLFIFSACSIQLLPTTLIGLRTTAGSQNPSDIIFPIFLSSIISLLTAIVLVFFWAKFKRKVKEESKTITIPSIYKK